jgi:hypothetical protein
MEGRLFEGDPATFAIVPVLLDAVALFAACVPTSRAAGVDPATVLRLD